MIRGEICWADFGVPFGSEPGFNRSILVIQSDALNQSKINTVIVIPLTTNLILENAPGNVFVDKDDSRLSKDSVLVVSQISVIDKSRLMRFESKLREALMQEVKDGVKLILDIE